MLLPSVLRMVNNNSKLRPIIGAVRQMISISDDELAEFLKGCSVRTCQRREFLSSPGKVCNEVYFVNKGIIRVVVTDKNGTEHTVHFALENQFIADYASFLQQIPSSQGLQALEPTEVVVLPRSIIEWGYGHLTEGDKLGRLVAEYYFIYLDNRIKNMYSHDPKERYDNITSIFPNIHNRAPQHMIASYLGITPVHLSRLKKAQKVQKV